MHTVFDLNKLAFVKFKLNPSLITYLLIVVTTCEFKTITYSLSVCWTILSTILYSMASFLRYCPFFQVLVLGHAFTLEQRLQLTEVHGSVSLHNLLIHNKGESLMLNLVLPLCLKIGCGNKDDPKLRNYDIKFTLNLLLNMINPGGNKNRSTNNGISASGSNIGRYYIYNKGIAILRQNCTYFRKMIPLFYDY